MLALEVYYQVADDRLKAQFQQIDQLDVKAATLLTLSSALVY